MNTQNSWLNGVVGGWQMQGIMLSRSGVPYTVTMSRDVANTGVSGQRPNRIASGNLENPTLERWLDTVAFVAAPNFTYGDSGLPNTPSFAAANSTLDAATAGRVTSTATVPRQMQVALKYSF